MITNFIRIIERVINLLLLIYNFVILNQAISTKAQESDYRSRKIGTLTGRISIIRRIQAKFLSIHVVIERILYPGSGLNLINSFLIVNSSNDQVVRDNLQKYFSID